MDEPMSDAAASTAKSRKSRIGMCARCSRQRCCSADVILFIPRWSVAMSASAIITTLSATQISHRAPAAALPAMSCSNR